MMGLDGGRDITGDFMGVITGHGGRGTKPCNSETMRDEMSQAMRFGKK
jgi:hypothetical protein